MDVGVPELLVILAVVLLLFGSTRLPALARSLGEAARELRHGLRSEEDRSDAPKPPTPRSGDA